MTSTQTEDGGLGPPIKGNNLAFLLANGIEFNRAYHHTKFDSNYVCRFAVFLFFFFGGCFFFLHKGTSV